MVIGQTSKFIEGFKTFSADDELMLANIKQALNYSSDNLSIPDAKLNLSKNNDTTTPTKPTNAYVYPNPSKTEPTEPEESDEPRRTEPRKTESGGTYPSRTQPLRKELNSESFKDIKKEEDEEESSDEESEASDASDKGKEQIDGFQGSLELEGRNLKNILLALLLSFVGYLVVYASVHNYIPINDISPQLKKFKNLVYGGIFFMLCYICLEVF